MKKNKGLKKAVLYLVGSILTNIEIVIIAAKIHLSTTFLPLQGEFCKRNAEIRHAIDSVFFIVFLLSLGFIALAVDYFDRRRRWKRRHR